MLEASKSLRSELGVKLKLLKTGGLGHSIDTFKLMRKKEVLQISLNVLQDLFHAILPL